jgi:hypothetical protein
VGFARIRKVFSLEGPERPFSLLHT